MHKRLKPLLALLAAGAFALPSQAQDIVFLSNSSETSPFVQAIKQLTEEYAAETGAGATFSFDASNQQNIMQRVQILAASGALPIMFTLPDRQALEELYKSGQLLDIKAKFTELGIFETIDPLFVTRAQASENMGPDVLFELPLQPAVELVTYNKALFAEAGVEPPTTWEEFLTLNQTLLDAGIQPLTAGGADSWPLLRWVGGYVFRLMGADIMDRVRRDEVPLTDPGFVEAVTAIVDLVDKGYFGTAVTTMSFTQQLDQFKTGEAAMMWGGSYIPSLIGGATITPEDLGTFAFPTVPNGVGTIDDYMVTAGLTTSMSKAAYDANPAAYDEWLKYIAPRIGDKMSELNAMSGFVGTTAPAADDPMQQFRAVIPTVKGSFFPWEQFFSSRAFIMAGTTIPLVVTHSLPVEQYLADLEAAN